MYFLFIINLEIHVYVAVLLTGVWIQYLQSTYYVLGLVLGIVKYLNPIFRN